MPTLSQTGGVDGLLCRMDMGSDDALHAARDKLRRLLQALGLPTDEHDRWLTGCSSLLRRLRERGVREVMVGLAGQTLWLQVAGWSDPGIRGLLHGMPVVGGWRFEATLRGAGEIAPQVLREIVERRSRAELIDDLQRHQASLEREIARRTEALSASELRARTVVEAAPLAVILVDARGCVTEWNGVAVTTFGHSAAEALGRPLQALIDLQGDALLPHLLTAGLDQDAGVRTQGRFWDLSAVRRDGSRVPVEVGMAVFPMGASWHGTLFARDSSERKMVEAALQTAKDSAESAATMKANFLANMSHEIRTPMNAILGMSHLALRTDLSLRQRDYVAKIQQSGQHLLGIINDVLDFSKIEADKLVVEHIEFELDRVLETVSNLIAEKAAEKGLELVFDIGRDVPPNLVGDPLRLGQILTNYANNAIKFTEAGEIDVLVRLRERSDDGVVLYFAVKDSGIGLTEEQAGRLFQPFQQADTSTTRKYGGTGLGLAISKKLAELMGGRVGVDSRLGQGSTFWFTSRLGLGQTPERRHLPTPDLRGLQVLVVDDNDTARVVLREMLGTMSFAVHEVASGLDALGAVEAAADAGRPYDVVYLDWQMPGIDGFETALRIRRLPLTTMPHIVMVTAFGRDELLRQAEHNGIGDVLMKPVNASALFNTTMRVLGAGRESQVPETDPGNMAMLVPVRGARVLLVEDNALNQEVASALLDEAGMQVEVAEHGALALEMVQSKRYDLVLMDMQMPVMDGVTATRAILALPDFKAPPIVAMTANAMHSDRELCRQAGMCDFISKPVEPEELWRVLLQWIVPRSPAAPPLPAPPLPVPPLAARGVQEVRPMPMADTPIDGLDQVAGLRRVLGRRELYQSLLRKFADGQKDAVVRMRQALSADDWSGAERLAHTLKGVAGNIGAVHVQEHAGVLEKALRDRCARHETEPLLAALEARLGALCRALGSVQPERREAARDPVAAADPAKVREACEHMRYLLVSDSSDALDLLRTHEALLRSAFPTRIDALSAAVNDYDFGQALTLLDEAMRADEPA